MDTTTARETPALDTLDADRACRFERYDCSDGCPVEAALEQIGGKWKGLALYHLAAGTKRFNELKRLCGTVTQRMLTKQLRELEADGLISRTVHPVVPPHVDYALTAKGEALVPVLTALRTWGIAHARQHEAE
ncbi:winged helix-turn-helix transcriptional regulator [Jannaschia aquimarina]|uniref:YybR_2 protein n=1 Tax=Jannaschia aquimarina TaxID=935700 RepID=A0A0D1D9P6_9RHOB|nr:helix-turn-helix domain-containing protein [Jannaschia aquimarina]KIT16618.1 putative HTH-type transcriptional regulator YybR [Jannaschia aquimarina]SNT42616.1 transcriptional regulator, HxlR family [Jannaschia aquimarina]